MKKKYSGAGVVLLEEYYVNKTKTREGPVFVLFKSCRTDEYTDLGGLIDKKDVGSILINTSIREALEESCGTIDLTKTNFAKVSYIDINHNGDYYRSHYICIARNMIKKDLAEIYKNNRKIIGPKRINPAWLETCDIKRFYVSDLYNNKINKCLDTEGTEFKIGKRMMDSLRQIKTDDIEKLIRSPRMAHLVIKTNNNFLSGTEAIEIL